jgi:predicted phosphodiesterase
MKAFSWVAPAKAGQVIKLALFSDVHFDSPDCDRETLKKHLDVCKKDGRYILVNGDWFDAIILSDRKRAVAHLIENTDQQLNKKLQESYDFLKPYQNNIIFMGRGNHEESIIKYNGIDLLQMLTTMLNMGEDHKILYGNYSNFLRFAFKEQGKNQRAYTYDIYATHGSGGNAPVTKGIIDYSRIGKSVIADLIWTGHRHNALIDASDPVLYPDQNGNIVLKNRQCIQTPSYQKGRSIDDNVNFAERFYTNQALAGFGEVNLRLVSGNRSKGERDYIIIPDIKITTIPSITIGSLNTAKVLKKER